ncbi:MAG: hypothetical protein J7485_06160 [Sphingobium sp.]|nr:hypothetical protein [Sphingobium sp.]
MRGTIFALGMAIAMAAIPAVAHHSFDGTFDRNRLVKLSGTVSEFTFTNPHSYFTLTVTGADGKPESWHIETTSATGLGARGWTEHSINPGEALAVEGWVAKDGRRYVRMRSMNHSDGTSVGLWLPPGPTPLPAA